MKSFAGTFLCLFGTVAVLFIEQATSQALHCQPNDAGCQRCSSSCHSLSPSILPECCEAFNACCDVYFDACKQCSSVAAKDKFFPEYCCASFTKCCDQVSTIKVSQTTEKPFRGDEVPASVTSEKQNTIPFSSLPSEVPQSPFGTSNRLRSTRNRASSQVVQSDNAVSSSQSLQDQFSLQQGIPLPSITQARGRETSAVETTTSERSGNRGRGRGTGRRRTSNTVQTKSDSSSRPVSTRRRVTSRGRVVEQ